MKLEIFTELCEFPFIYNGRFYDGFQLGQNRYCTRKCKNRNCLYLASNTSDQERNTIVRNYCQKGYDLLLYKDSDGNCYALNGIIKKSNSRINKDIYKSRTEMIVDDERLVVFEKKIVYIEEQLGKSITSTDDLGRNYAILHDVKTAIGIVSNYAEEIVNFQPGADFSQKLRNSPSEIRNLYDAVDLTNSQLQMIDIVINPDSITYGKTTPTNIYRLFEKISKLLSSRAAKKNLRIRWSSSHDIERALYYDAIQFVPLILLDNAIKYSKPNRDITVFYKLIGSCISIDVKSYGDHIPEEDRSLIFDKLKRGGNAIDSGAGGIGLGLYILKKIVNAHNGGIEYYAKQDLGGNYNMFRIELDYDQV